MRSLKGKEVSYPQVGKLSLGKPYSRRDGPPDLGGRVGISVEPGHPQKHVTGS